MEKTSFRGHLRYLLATDLAAFLFATLLVLLVSRIRALLSPIAVAVVVAALAVAFGCDVALWLFGGIRLIELDKNSLTLFRGRKLKPQIIAKDEIAGLVSKRRFMRRVVIVRLSWFHVVRITEEAFSPETFNRFLAVLEGWDQRN
jgi:hypothetical protein